MEPINNLIHTLEILGDALSASDRDKALQAITLLMQQFTTTFGHVAHIFLAILFLETLKVHILYEEFKEARGGALALLARLRAVNAAIKQSAAQSSPANSDASAEDVLDVVLSSTAQDVADWEEEAFWNRRAKATELPGWLPRAISATRALCP